MIFLGETNKKGIKSKSFTEVGVEAATHVKVKGKEEFYKINKELKFYPVDAVGDTADEEISYLDMEPGKRYRCKVGASGELFEIDSSFYSQLVFMSKAEGDKGDFYRCEGGKYVKKTEVQIPSYRSVNVPISHMLTDTVGGSDTRKGKYYANIEYIEYKDGEKSKRVYLPNENVKREGDKWYYLKDGKKIYGEYKAEPAEYRHILVPKEVDGEVVEQIVSMDRVELRDGKYYIKNDSDDDSGDELIGETSAELERPLVEGVGNAFGVAQRLVIGVEEDSESKAEYKDWKHDHTTTKVVEYTEGTGPDGLKRVTLTYSNDALRYIYANGTEVIYTTHPNYKVNPGKRDKVKIIVVEKLEFVSSSESGMIVNIMERQKEFATDVVSENGKITAYNLGDVHVTDIEWADGDGLDQSQIRSYKINGKTVTDVHWEDGKIKDFRLVEQLEDGSHKTSGVVTKGNPLFDEHTINCTFNNKLENLQWNENGLASFKLGEYSFSDIEWNADKTIYRCTIKKDGAEFSEENVNFEEDKRFAQLRFSIKIALKNQNIRPLVQTKLFEKREGEYELAADYVQTEAAENGIARATKLESLQQARQAQSEFSKKPFETHVIDENGVVHQLKDVTTTYTGVGEFQYDHLKNNPAASILENYKVEYKKGKLVVQATDLEKAIVSDCSTFGYMFCSNPFTLIIGIPMLLTAATASVVGPAVRRNKQHKLTKQTLQEYTDDFRKEAKKKCKEEIDKLVSDYTRGVKKLRKRYSEADVTPKIEELTAKFRTEYAQTIARLQVLDQGNIECSFDLSKNGKITKENYMAYLACIEKRDELQYGKKDNANLAKKLKEINKDKTKTKSEKLFAQIEVMQELGGRNGQREAYKLIRKNAKTIVEKLNEGKSDKEKISVEQYLKAEEEKFIAKMFECGSLEDKLEAYKKSDEYYIASPKQKKELLSAKRKQLEAELKNIKVDHVELATQTDENGNNLAEEYILDANAHMERVIVNVVTGSNEKIPEFKYECRKDMTEDELSVYLPNGDKKASTVVHESIAQVADSNEMEVLAHDEARAELGVTTITERVDQIKSDLDARQSKVNQAKATNDYEAAFANRTVIRASKQQFDAECEEVEELTSKVPNSELKEAEMGQLDDKIIEVRTEFGTQLKTTEKTMEATRRQYYNDCHKASIEEYASLHPEEYSRYKAQAEAEYAVEVEENKKRGIKLPVKKNEEFIKRDFLNYKIKQDKMHAYAMAHRDEFKKFVTHTMFEEFATKTNEERKAKGEKTLGKKDMMLLFKDSTTSADREMAFGKSHDVSVDYSNRPIEFRAIAVRNNIEERTYAQVYAAQHPEELEQFRAKMQTELAASGQSLTDEGLICAFYDDARATVPDLHDKIKAEEGFEQAFDAAAMHVIEERKVHGKELVVSTELTEEQKKALEEEKSKKKDSGKDKAAEAVDESVDTHDAEDVEEEALAV